jgi:hypothetical protein
MRPRERWKASRNPEKTIQMTMRTPKTKAE